MNYKYVISFLAGPKLQEQWAKPASKWILCKDRHEGEWSPEFMDTGIPATKEALVRCHPFVSLEDMNMKYWVTSEGAYGFKPDSAHVVSWKLWYNPDVKIFMITVQPDATLEHEEAIKKHIDGLDTNGINAMFVRRNHQFSEIM